MSYRDSVIIITAEITQQQAEGARIMSSTSNSIEFERR